jgi:hypothetical protein
MVRIGSWCIDAAARATKNHADATSDCHGLSTMICPIEVLMACDHLNIGKGATTPLTCGSVTDAVGSVSLVWTAGLAYDSPYTNSIFAEIAAYNGADNTIDRLDDGQLIRFFCCAPGYFY